jgi:cullin-associated NEDD8-dissociated protein 1
MYTLLETCLNKLDINTYLDQVIAGLSDDDDIKLQCYLMLVKLSHVAATAVAQRKPNARSFADATC